jgi:2-oxoglutarate dehydrogenase E2 component (dihydrolipoamide succinyltransferase)
MAVLVDVTLPDLQEGTESVLERWLRQPGDSVRLHEPLLEINTDKAVVEVPAPATGILREALKSVNDAVRPGEVLGRIEVIEDSKIAAEMRRPSAPIRKETAPATPAERNLSPAVRQLVKKHNLDVSKIRGTGRSGRITHEDVQNYLEHQVRRGGEAPLAGTRVPHSPLRRRIAQHMVESLLRTAPHVTAVFDADLSSMIAHRQRHQDALSQKGVRLTYTAYFVAAAVQALQAVPGVNSRWHEDALEVFSDCNIGIATAVEGGLLVPVIHRAQTLDLFGIAARLQELTAKARNGKLEPFELRGGTFTITNHGVSGSLIATPIINQPQSAILGIGKMEKRLVVVERGGEEAVQIKPMAYVTLTIDHRVLDGFQANAFLGKLVQALSDWPA